MKNENRSVEKNNGSSVGGRPRLLQEHARDTSIRVRMSAVELAQVRAAAADAALPLATYIRLEALKCRIRPIAIPKANLIYVDELNRLGNNLNQLLVLIYTNRAPLGVLSTLKELQRVVEEVKATLLGVGEGDDP